MQHDKGIRNTFHGKIVDFWVEMLKGESIVVNGEPLVRTFRGGLPLPWFSSSGHRKQTDK